jgi:hypothetical protein
MANSTAVLRKLLVAARYAHTELFALMLAEKAHKVQGRYTETFEGLDKALKGAEEALKADAEKGRGKV